jgi:hypothetical protein
MGGYGFNPNTGELNYRSNYAELLYIRVITSREILVFTDLASAINYLWNFPSSADICPIVAEGKYNKNELELIRTSFRSHIADLYNNKSNLFHGSTEEESKKEFDLNDVRNWAVSASAYGMKQILCGRKPVWPGDILLELRF